MKDFVKSSTLNITPPALRSESFASEGSKKRRRSSGSAELEQFAHSSGSGQLSLLDVWGNGNSIQDHDWKIGVKYRKQLRKHRNHHYHNTFRNPDYNIINNNDLNSVNNTWNQNHLIFSNNNNNHDDQQLISSHKTEILVHSSSIASKTSSGISLFSLHDSSAQSDITDGFDDLDLEFDPNLFVLEVDPKHGLEPSWLEQLKPILMQPEIISLHQQLGLSHLGFDYKAGQQPSSPFSQVLPHPHQLYNWSRLTPLEQVKVVILGSRPSQSLGQSHGLAFSQPLACKRLSGPIESIHRELFNEYPDQFIKPNHGSLVSWAKSGVLLLNEVQTTARDQPNDHSKFGWSEFTTKILEVVSKYGGSMYSSNTTTTTTTTATTTTTIGGTTPQSSSSHVPGKGIVFIAWGEEASRLIKSAGIYFSDRNHLVISCKGSPYAHSAHEDGFFNNHHFTSCNEFLSSTYGPETQVNWCNLEPLDTPF